MFTQDFRGDLEALIAKVERREPFAFARYADGEYAVLKGQPIKGMDGWEMKPEYENLRAHIWKSLDHIEDNYFYGISCPCCDSPKHDWFKQHMYDKHSDNLTYSNLFVNGNYKRFKEWIPTLNVEDVKVVSCEMPKGCEWGWHPIEPTALALYNYDIEYYKEQWKYFASGSSRIYLISAGPLSEIIIHWMYEANPTNTYIDVGSAIDEFTKGKVTRGYQIEGTEFSNKICAMTL